MQILYIGNKLARHGNNRTSIDTLGPLLEAEGFQMRYASSARNQVVRMADMIWKTLTRARQAEYVLIDTYSTTNFWYAFAISQICRITKSKYIPILHGGNLPQRLKQNPKISRMIFANAHLCVSPSKFLLAEFDQAGFSNLIYIPNSIEISKYQFKLREKVECKLLWVRSLAQIYNPKMALHIAKKLQQFYNVKLSVVGPDKENMLPGLKKLAAELNVDVNFTGALSREQWTTLSADFDIFLNCTHFDNMPVSVIEAMALGMPVVSTNVGGLPYLLDHGQTALLSSDDNIDEMVSNINSILIDSHLATTLSRNARRAAEQFDWQTIKNKWLEILR